MKRYSPLDITNSALPRCPDVYLADEIDKIAGELYKRTRANPELWDTDGICMLIDELMGE